MQWTGTYIIYRINAAAKLDEVCHPCDLKKANYWLKYIAAPGDILCKTPLHPKHSQKTKCPEYASHKEKSGQPTSDLDAWLNDFAKPSSFDLTFPDEQVKNPA